MTDLIAKPIIENKYWVVESQGNKIAAVLAVEDGGYTYVSEDLRKNYPSIKLLKKEHNIEFKDNKKSKSTVVKTDQHTAWGYPTVCKPHNALWDVKGQFAVFNKNNRSKSFYCAGHFLINVNGEWTYEFCPKHIIVSRYEFIGPYFTKNAAQTELRNIRDTSSTKP